MSTKLLYKLIAFTLGLVIITIASLALSANWKKERKLEMVAIDSSLDQVKKLERGQGPKSSLPTLKVRELKEFPSKASSSETSSTVTTTSLAVVEETEESSEETVAYVETEASEAYVEETEPVTEAPVETTAAPLETTAAPVYTVPANSPSFTSPGSGAAAWANYDVVKSLMRPNGCRNYESFSDNGDGTITVDGLSFTYTEKKNRTITSYDGVECCRAVGCHSPLINHNTATGIPAMRGLAASAFGGLPFGTVLFVENYGLAVVADRHGMGEWDFDLIDVSFNPREVLDGTCNLGKVYWNVYIIYTP